MGGKSWQCGQSLALLIALQLGQMKECVDIMLFLQRLHKMLPSVPQPLQECGATRSSGLKNVVIFTIFGIFLLILL